MEHHILATVFVAGDLYWTAQDWTQVFSLLCAP